MPFVYFIQAGDDGPIKIGFSKSPQRRMVELQTMHAHQLFLVGVMPCESSKTERALHRLFAATHIRGEWYRPTEELLQVIARAGHIDDARSMLVKQRVKRAMTGHTKSRRAMGWGLLTRRHVVEPIQEEPPVVIPPPPDRSWRQHIGDRMRQRRLSKRPSR